MSYTKGPYRRHFWVVFDNDGNKLADFDVSVENAQLDPQTVIDNANLFVAGPDLVEALEMAHNIIVNILTDSQLDERTPCGITVRNYISTVEKALTKAKGGKL